MIETGSAHVNRIPVSLYGVPRSRMRNILSTHRLLTIEFMYIYYLKGSFGRISFPNLAVKLDVHKPVHWSRFSQFVSV